MGEKRDDPMKIMKLSQKKDYAVINILKRRKENLSKAGNLTEKLKIANSKVKKTKHMWKEASAIADKMFLRTEQGRHCTRRLWEEINTFIILVNRK